MCNTIDSYLSYKSLYTLSIIKIGKIYTWHEILIWGHFWPQGDVCVCFFIWFWKSHRLFYFKSYDYQIECFKTYWVSFHIYKTNTTPLWENLGNLGRSLKRWFGKWEIFAWHENWYFMHLLQNQHKILISTTSIYTYAY